MPLPAGSGFTPIGGGNVDAGPVELLSMLQRNVQVRRASGVGVLSLTGSVLYAIWGTAAGTVSLADMSGTFVTAMPLPLVFDQGIPTANPVSGGALTVTPSNLSTVNMLVLYK